MIRDSCQDGILRDEDTDVGNLQAGSLDFSEGARKRPFLFGRLRAGRLSWAAPNGVSSRSTPKKKAASWLPLLF